MSGRSTTASRWSSEVRIGLTELEERLFAALMRVVEDGGLRTTLRVAGGWVRDKMLGVQEGDVDIDIALDDMLGREFAEKVNEWLARNHFERRGVGVIHRNPEQSKHLETARMKVSGVQTASSTSEIRQWSVLG